MLLFTTYENTLLIDLDLQNTAFVSEQEAHGPWRFADVMACHKRFGYYASLVKTGSTYKSLLTKPKACIVTYYKKIQL